MPFSECRDLFVYGTLLPENAPPEMAPVIAQLAPVGPGSLGGRLYDFGDFPGAVTGHWRGRRIAGRVYQLPPNPAVLRQLDEYEGYDPAAPERSLFVRRLCPVRLDAGDRRRCWVYVYNRDPGDSPELPNGAYRPPGLRPLD